MQAGTPLEFSRRIRTGLLTTLIYVNPFGFRWRWNPLHLQKFTEEVEASLLFRQNSQTQTRGLDVSPVQPLLYIRFTGNRAAHRLSHICRIYNVCLLLQHNVLVMNGALRRKHSNSRLNKTCFSPLQANFWHMSVALDRFCTCSLQFKMSGRHQTGCLLRMQVVLNTCGNKASSLFLGLFESVSSWRGWKGSWLMLAKPLRTQQQQRIVGGWGSAGD